MDIQRTYYDNGKLWSEGAYKNGLKDGVWKEWYDNGQLWSEGVYKNGLNDGFWRFWYDNGQLWSEKVYRDDRNDGVWKEWYDNGQLESEGVYKDGLRDGVWKDWYDNGRLKSETVYRYGKKVVPEPEVVKLNTKAECLIYKEPPTPGQRYLICGFSEEHVMNHEFMVEFKKTTDLTKIECMYCQHRVKGDAG